MDAKITTGKPENFESETYREYLIVYDRNAGIFIVGNSIGYCRGISSLRKDAKRWIDLLIAGKVRP